MEKVIQVLILVIGATVTDKGFSSLYMISLR